jgi:phosphatidylinositol alpha-1,6-mannosyltransferase
VFIGVHLWFRFSLWGWVIPVVAMSVLLVSENFPPAVGGTCRWFWELYRRMPRSGVAIAAGAGSGALDFDRRHDLRVERLPLTFPSRGCLSWRSWAMHRAAVRRLRELIDRRGVERLHCARALPEGWLALGCGRPFLCFVHGEELSTARTSRELSWMTARVLGRSAALVANSRNTADVLVADWRVPREKIRVLHPGVDTAHFTPAPRVESVRDTLGWRERTVVLTVSRLQKRKGHDRMIEAVGRLRERFPSLLYAIVGDGEERAALAAQVRRSGLSSHVLLHGELDEPWLLHAYQQCDLFVLPNRTVAGDFEGFGMVLLEAQACGKAAIAGRSGGTTEALCEGESGLIVDCESEDDLAAATGALLADGERLARMGAAARVWVERRFDFDVQASRARSILEIVP